MKTRKWIPILMLGIGLGFTHLQANSQSGTGFEIGTSDGSLFGETCTVAIATSLSRDGIEMGSKSNNYRYTFCPDNNLTITNAYTGYTASGVWYLDKVSNRVRIEVYGKDPDGGHFGDFANWLNGEWGILEHSSNVLELNRFYPSGGLSDNGNSWILRLEAKMKEISGSEK